MSFPRRNVPLSTSSPFRIACLLSEFPEKIAFHRVRARALPRGRAPLGSARACGLSRGKRKRSQSSFFERVGCRHLPRSDQYAGAEKRQRCKASWEVSRAATFKSVGMPASVFPLPQPISRTTEPVGSVGRSLALPPHRRPRLR